MIVVDVETSGLSPIKNGMVSLGAVDLENPNRQFYGECRVFYGAVIDEKALEINGFTKDQVIDVSKQSEAELLKDFLNWVEAGSNKVLAGMNPTFDRDFLRATAKRSGINWPLGYRTIDLHSLAFAHMLRKDIENNEGILSMDSILELVGLEKREGAHNALDDAKLTSEAIYRLIFQKGLFEDYLDFSLPKHLKKGFFG